MTSRLVQQLSLFAPQLVRPSPPAEQLGGATVPLSPPPLDEPDDDPELLPLLEPELLPDPELLPLDEPEYEPELFPPPDPDPLLDDEAVAS